MCSFAAVAVLATAGVAAALVIVLGRWDVHVYGVKVAAEPRDSLLDARYYQALLVNNLLRFLLSLLHSLFSNSKHTFVYTL